MAANTAIVNHVTGKAWVRASDGSLAEIKAGSRVPADAEIVTGPGASVELAVPGQPAVVIGENREVTIGEDVFRAQNPAEASVVPPNEPDSARLLGEMLDDTPPVADSGQVLPGGNLNDGGGSFVRLMRVVEETTPLSLSYPRPHQDLPDTVRYPGGWGGREGNDSPQRTSLAGGGVTARGDEDGDAIAPLNMSHYFTDPDGDPLSYRATGLPPGLTIDPKTGVVSGKIDGSASQGGPGGNGEYVVKVTATDPDGKSVSHIIKWTVTNPPPQADDDAAATDEGTALNVGAAGGVLGNDADPDGDNLVVSAVDGDTGMVGKPVAGDNGGTFSINPDGSYTFDPAGQFDDLPAGQTRQTSITYTISDGEGGFDTATLTVTVQGTNDVPVVTDDARSVTEDAGVTAGMLSVDGAVTITDPDAGESVFDPATAAFTGSTHAGGQLGVIAINPDGTYTYRVANGAVQFLKAGESIVETYTVKSADGTQTSTITITINGTNDVPVVTDDAQSVTEDAGAVGGKLSVDGAVTITDADNGESTFDPATTAFTGTTHPGGQLGAIVVDPDGSYTYEVDNAAVQFLKAGETIVETYTVQSADGTATSTITITIHGTNDVPVVTDDAQSVTEDAGVVGGKLSVDGAVTIADADNGESTFDPATTTFTGSTHAGGQLGAIVVNPDGTYTYEVDNAAVQFLKAGETIVETYTVKSADGTATSTVTITIHGTNDVPVVTDDAQSVTEDAGVVGGKLSVDGAVTITDADNGESAFDPATTTFTGTTHAGGQLGSIVVNADGTYTYQVDNAAVQFLKAGETIVETYTVQSADGTATSTITITIHGTNDVPVVTNDAQSVTEDASAVGGKLSVDGAVTITDADNGESAFDPATTTFTGTTHAGGQLGSIVVNADGTYTYEVDNAAVQFLKAGETIIETYTVQSADGTATSTITITIHGTNDVPVVTDDAQSVTEDVGVTAGMLSVDGAVTITDADTGEATFDPTTTLFAGSTHAGGQLGVILVNPDGTYTYKVANSAVQFLKAGESIVETYTVKSADGTGTSTITITINGTNDVPVVTDDAQSVTEDAGAVGGKLSVDGAVTITDADDGESAFDPATTTFTGTTHAGGQLGSIAVNADGTYTYEVDNAAVQFLKAGETIVETYTVQSADGTQASTITITIHGTNDVPVVTDDAQSVTEDAGAVGGILSVDGAVTVADTDDGESTFDPATTAFTGSTHAGGQLGSIVVNPDGTYTYQVDNAAVQFLKAGEAIVETYTVQSADGTATSTITITIHGTNDVPVVTDDAQSVTEDAGVVGGKLSVDGAVTITDTDDGESAFDPVTTTFTGSTHAGGQLGAIVVNPDGSYTYEVDNAAVQFLKAGESIVETYTVQSVDGTATSTITITIHGTNDVPVVTDDAQSVTEDAGAVGGKLSVDGAVTITDTDDGESAFDPATTTFTGTTHAGGQLGSISVNPDGTYTYEVDNAAVQFLKAGESIVETYTVNSADGTATSTITITINGTNDVPVLTDDAQSVTEDTGVTAGMLGVDGAVTITDADTGEATFDPATTAFTGTTHPGGQLGSIVVNPDGTYTYKVANSEVQFLKAGETIVETYTVQSADGTGTSTITITIHGTNDVPVVTDDAQSVTEDAGVVGGKLSVGGAVTITDADDGESTFDPGSTVFTGSTHPGGQLGSIAVNADGTYTYEVDNAAVQFLKAGETIVETYTVQSADGAQTSTITITINGTNDVPVVTDDAQSVTEDAGVVGGKLSVDGAVTITDTDDGESTFDPGSTAFTGSTHAGGQLGSIVVNPDGTYTYEVDNAAVQFLKAGESIVETYTVQSADGTATSTITITIHGTNDVPVVTNDARSVTEDVDVVGGVLSVDGAVTITDSDDGESVFDPATATFTGSTHAGGQLGSIVVNPDGTYTYRVNNSAVQFLKAGESIVETYTVQSDDGTATSTITITINGTNDVPVVTDDAQSVTEDVDVAAGMLSVDGVVTITDTDDGESTFDPGSTAFTGSTHPGGQLGSIVVHADGTYTYEVDNAVVQFLKKGESVVETYTVQSADGTATSTITITINGTNDAPVANVDSNLVVESGVVNGGNTPTAGQPSANGNVLDNDTDVDAGTVLQVSAFSLGATVGTLGTPLQGMYGSLVLNANGSYTYILDNSLPATQNLASGATAAEHFTYTITDGDGGTSSATLTIGVTGTNDAPVITSSVAQATGAVVEQGHYVSGVDTATGTLTSSDVDAGATATWSIQGAGAGTYGNIAIDPATGTWVYTLDNARAATQALNKNDQRTETFTAVVTDEHGATATQTIVVHVQGNNDAPQATNDSVTLDEDPAGGSVSGNVLTNDLDVDDTLTVVRFQVDGDPTQHAPGSTVNIPGVGSLLIGSDGSFTFTPLPDYSGAVPDVTYTVRESGGDSLETSAKLLLTIRPVADAPDLGAPADVGTPEDTVVALGLTAPQVTDRVDQNGAGEGDNPELLGPITLNGIPSGVQLLDGANGDAVLFTSTGGPITIVLTDPDAGNGHYTGATGTLQLTKQQYEALKVLAAEHDADNFTVVVTVGSYEVDDGGAPLVGIPPADESVDVLVDVQAVTDDVALTFNDGSASKTFVLDEDQTFDLSAQLQAAFQDLDGSEQRSLEISGLPAGSTVFVDGSPRTVGASGSITIDAKAGANGQTGDLGSFPQIGIRPPANFSGDITDVSVTLRAQDTDADSSGAIAEKTATVDLDFYTRPISDSVRIADTSMPEDTQATFLSSLQFIDADGSETLTGLVIQGIPAGWVLRDGDGNVLLVGDGATPYTVPASALDGGSAAAAFRDYTLQPPAHDSRDAAITVQATTRDERLVNGVALHDENTHDVPVDVRVAPVAEVVATDTDDDGQPDLTMAGGHTYGNGTAGAEDGWFTLAQDGYDPGLGWNNQDGVANGGTEQTYALLTPVLTAGAAGETAIGAQFRYSADGGATWVTLAYDGTPVEIPAEYLSTVQFMPPEHVSGTFQIEMQARTVDTDPDTGAQVEATSGSAVLDGIVIDPVADTVTLSVGGVSGRAEGLEDTAIPLSLRPSSSDPTETFDVTISDIPPGAMLTYGGAVLTVVGGSVSIIGFDRNVPLTITPPPNSNQDFDLTVTAVSVDTQGGVTDYSDPQTLTLTVDVHGVADEADILLRQDDPSIAPEDQAFAEADVEANGNAINLSDLVRGTALTDTDGSEVLTLRITGLPEGFSIQGATFMGGTGLTREWVLTPAQLASARLTVPENYSGTVKGQLYAVTTENDGDSHTSADLGLTAVVTPSPESVMTISSSVVEDTRSPIDFSIASNGGDTNESLTKVWIRVDDVDGNPNFTLYLGENGPALADAGLTVVNKGGSSTTSCRARRFPISTPRPAPTHPARRSIRPTCASASSTRLPTSPTTAPCRRHPANSTRRTS